MQSSTDSSPVVATIYQGAYSDVSPFLLPDRNALNHSPHKNTPKTMVSYSNGTMNSFWCNDPLHVDKLYRTAVDRGVQSEGNQAIARRTWTDSTPPMYAISTTTNWRS